MNRRAFLSGVTLSGLMMPWATEAQPRNGNRPRIALLLSAPRPDATPAIKAFENGLAALGYVNGKNISLTYYETNGSREQLARVAPELVRASPDVIVVWSTMGTVTIKSVTSTIPVVFINVGNP